MTDVLPLSAPPLETGPILPNKPLEPMKDEATPLTKFGRLRDKLARVQSGLRGRFSGLLDTHSDPHDVQKFNDLSTQFDSLTADTERRLNEVDEHSPSTESESSPPMDEKNAHDKEEKKPDPDIGYETIYKPHDGLNCIEVMMEEKFGDDTLWKFHREVTSEGKIGIRYFRDGMYEDDRAKVVYDKKKTWLGALYGVRAVSDPSSEITPNAVLVQKYRF